MFGLLAQGWFWDARYALRKLRKAPIFTLTAIATLALGIGANSTIFSWMNSTLFSPVPGAQPRGPLIAITRGHTSGFSYPDLVDLREHTRSLREMTGFDLEPVDLTGAQTPQRLWSSLTTANYFDVMGVQPWLGRFFTPEEERSSGGAPVVVLGYRTWQLLFDGDPKILGRTIDLNHHPFTVIGVAPALFQGASTGLSMDLWVPLVMQQLVSSRDLLHDRSDAWLNVVGTLAPGVSREEAQRELTVEMGQLASAYPKDHLGSNELLTFPMWRAPGGANQYMYQLLPPLMALAVVVLILACVNVANLFLVRAVARRHELAIRLALGANRARLVRQLLVESVLVAFAGGSAALLATIWTARSFARFIPASDFPVNLKINVDARVLAATFLLSVFTGIALGMLSALRSSKLVPVTVLKDDGSTTSGGQHKVRLISILVAVQITLSFLLLVCGGLFLRGFHNAQHTDPGFHADDVLLTSLDLFPANYSAQQGLAFQRELLHRLEQIHGVQSASFGNWALLGFIAHFEEMLPEGYAPQRNESLSVMELRVAPNYFATMQIPIVAGRPIDAGDKSDSEFVAVVNEKFAAQYWKGQNALGHRVKIDGDWFTVVGVAKNSKYLDLDEATRPFVYWPASQRYAHTMVLHVRVTGDPKLYTAQVEKAVHSLNADLPLYGQYPLSRNVELASTGPRIAGTFAGMFGFVGLALAGIGIYGVVAYGIRQRLHEIGIRIALGAQRKDVFALVLREGLRLTTIGMGAGLVCSLLLTPFLRSQLFNVAPTDGLTYLCVACLLFVVTLGACFFPARRATQVEPVRILRYE